MSSRAAARLAIETFDGAIGSVALPSIAQRDTLSARDVTRAGGGRRYARAAEARWLPYGAKYRVRRGGSRGGGAMGKFRIHSHGRLQEWVAEERGYFKDEGLDYDFLVRPLDLTTFHPDPGSVQTTD